MFDTQNKMAPMPGLDINHYKGYVIRWDEAIQKYNIFKKEEPDNIIGVCETIRDGREMIDRLVE